MCENIIHLKCFMWAPERINMKYNLTVEENVAKSLENKAKSESKRLGIEISPLDLIRTAVGKEYDEDFIPHEKFVKIKSKSEYAKAYIDLPLNKILFFNSRLEKSPNEFCHHLNNLSDKFIVENSTNYPWIILSKEPEKQNGFKTWYVNIRNQYTALRLNSDECLISVFSYEDKYYSSNLNNKSITDPTGSFYIVPNKFINFFFKKETNE